MKGTISLDAIDAERAIESAVEDLRNEIEAYERQNRLN